MNTRPFAYLGQTEPALVKVGPTRLVRMYGYKGVTDMWLQIHDVAAVGDIATGTIMKSLDCPGESAFMWDFHEGLVFPRLGLAIALSTTETTYTATDGAFDIQGEIEEWENPEYRDCSTSTPATSYKFNPWAGGGYKRLVRFGITLGTPPTDYLQLHNAANPSAGRVPIKEWSMADVNAASVVTANVEKVFDFGLDGLIMTAPCIAFSSTSGLYTADTGISCNFTGKYRAV